MKKTKAKKIQPRNIQARTQTIDLTVDDLLSVVGGVNPREEMRK